MNLHLGRLARRLPPRLSIVRATSYLIALFLLLWPGQARAGADEAVTETARAQFAHGVELADRGDYQAALQAFSDAYAASPHVAVLYNIGQAQVALGRPLEAAATLSRYLREGQDSVPPERRRQVEAQLELLQSFLVDLDLSKVPQSVAIRIDGREVGRTPLSEPLRLAAGTHTLTATPDETLLMNATPTPPATPSAGARSDAGSDARSDATATVDLSRATTTPAHGGLRAALPYTMVGAGVALGAGALLVYLLKRGDYQRWQSGETALKNDTPGSPSYQARAADNHSLAASLTTANHTILGLSIAGGALVAAGASLYLVDWASARRSTSFTLAWAGGSSVVAGWRGAW